MNNQEAWSIVHRFKTEYHIDGVVSSAWHRSVDVHIQQAVKSNLSEDQFRELLAKSLDIIERFWHAACVWPQRQTIQVLWRHNNENSFETDNFDYSGMKHVAAAYLASPEIRTNYLDWALLDALVYMEYRTFWFTLMANDFNIGSINFAFLMSGESEIRYNYLRSFFWLISKAAFLSSAYGAFWLINNSLPIYGYILATVLVLISTTSLVLSPGVRKAKKKNLSMLKTLGLLYQHIGHPTISPKRLKDLLEAATKEGNILDGAVFALVDLMTMRNDIVFTRNEESER